MELPDRAGHRQISGSKRTDDLIGRIHGNPLIGLSYGWWISKHNRHHAHPNQIGRDPDIAGRAIAFAADQSRGRHGAGAWLARSQSWLFFPMLLLEGLNLHAAGSPTSPSEGSNTRSNITCSRRCRGRASGVHGHQCWRSAPLATFLTARRACWPPMRRYCGTSTSSAAASPTRILIGPRLTPMCSLTADHEAVAS